MRKSVLQGWLLSSKHQKHFGRHNLAVRERTKASLAAGSGEWPQQTKALGWHNAIVGSLGETVRVVLYQSQLAQALERYAVLLWETDDRTYLPQSAGR